MPADGFPSPVGFILFPEQAVPYGVFVFLVVDKESGKVFLQRLPRKALLEHAVHGHAYHPGLLGHDKDHGVAVFAYSYSRPVARAEILYDIGVGGQRQKAAGGIQALVSYYQRAVMERRLVEEDVPYQKRGYLGVDDRSGFITSPSLVPRSKTIRAPVLDSERFSAA